MASHARLSTEQITVILSAALFAVFGLTKTALAAEQEVKNDSVDDFAQAYIVGDFVANEQAGARLTSPCTGYIVGVKILWLEGAPGHDPSLEQAIYIFNGATFPTPGAELAYLEGPLMTPGVFNEFRYLDEEQQFPIHVAVTQGQNFYVTLEFENPTDVGNGGPSVVRDTNGCQASKNVIYASGMWWNACSLGVAGDFAIRAVVDCPAPAGACCQPNGSCTNNVDEEDCHGAGQTFFSGQTCAQVTCPLPTGACCLGGGCLDEVDEESCKNAGGTYAGDDTLCSENVCVPGACCTSLGDCSLMVAAACTGSGGTFQGPGTSCTPNPCPQPKGACCTSTDSCFNNQYQVNCEAISGAAWAGPFTTCFTGLCPICDDGDADRDGDVDLVDFARLQSCFGCASCGAGSCKCVDMNNDNAVNHADYVEFQSQLESGGPQ